MMTARVLYWAIPVDIHTPSMECMTFTRLHFTQAVWIVLWIISFYLAGNKSNVFHRWCFDSDLPYPNAYHKGCLSTYDKSFNLGILSYQNIHEWWLFYSQNFTIYTYIYFFFKFHPQNHSMVNIRHLSQIVYTVISCNAMWAPDIWTTVTNEIECYCQLTKGKVLINVILGNICVIIS